MAFAFVSAVYLLDATTGMSMWGKAFALRYSLITLSLVVILSIAAWLVGGARGRWKR